jgi:hypothetical protein
MSVHRTAFEFGISRAVTLSSEDYKKLDITSRQVPRSFSDFQQCQFRALSAVYGESDDTGGAAVFSDGFPVSFKSCTFSGNSAVAGGCCNLLHSNFDFDLCNFTMNRATFEAGTISVDSAILQISESNFVLNEAELYVGVLKAVNSTVIGDTLIFHANRAVFHSAVVDADASNVEITATQFSSNRVENEDGGIVLNLKASKLKLIGCNFETIARENGTRKPIRGDIESRVTIKQSCFDTQEAHLREYIEGSYSNSIGSIFTIKCHCSHVAMPQVFDIVEKSITLDDSLLTEQFIFSAVGLAGMTLVVLLLLVCEPTLLRLKLQWVLDLLNGQR